MAAYLDIISFTEAGETLGRRVGHALEGSGLAVSQASGRRSAAGTVTHCPAGVWAEAHFQKGHVLLFIGAAGIAVRAIAPLVRSKTTDPAVIVMDEKGCFVIPILSGHIGEANDWAKRLAALTGGQAALTTATDVNGLMAVDAVAARHHMLITDMKAAARFSAALLKERRARFIIPERFRPYLIPEDVPPYLTVVSGEAETASAPTDCLVTPALTSDGREAEIGVSDGLVLIPRCLVLGVGCRRGKDSGELIAFAEACLRDAGLDSRAAARVVSVDLKKDEEAIQALSRALDVPYETYPAEVLQAVPGEFRGSDFVKKTTGVDNICERAAVAAGASALLLGKTARNGMTLAVGIATQSIDCR